jgi:hypothetical protein
MEIEKHSLKEIEMKTSLNVRNTFVLTLKVLVPVIAVSMFLISLMPVADLSASLGDPVQPNPRVKFASLEGWRTPSAELEGRRPPPASLEGRKPPSSELDGRRSPSAELEGKRLPPASLEGRKPPSSELDGWRTPSAELEGRRSPSASLEGRRSPSAQPDLSSLPAAPLTLVDGLIVLALGALLLAPVRKSKLEIR